MGGTRSHHGTSWALQRGQPTQWKDTLPCRRLEHLETETILNAEQAKGPGQRSSGRTMERSIPETHGQELGADVGRGAGGVEEGRSVGGPVTVEWQEEGRGGETSRSSKLSGRKSAFHSLSSCTNLRRKEPTPKSPKHTVAPTNPSGDRESR